MAGFFKSILGKKIENAARATQLSPERLAGMPFDELLILLTSRQRNMSFGDSLSILRRLYQIALFENHIPEEQRTKATTLADALAADLEHNLSSDPEGLAILNSAISQTRALAKQGGYGSLTWRLNEYQISAKETIPYIMMPAHRHLLPDFLEVVGPEKIAVARQHMVRELVLQADYKSQNSVLILHGLAAKGDKGAAALFAAADYRALLNVPNDYAAGRKVLVGLDILPQTSGVRPFAQTFEIKRLLESIHDLLQRMNERAETDARLTGLREDKKYALLTTLVFLRLELTTALLSQLYGDTAVYDIVSIFRNTESVQQLDRFRKVAETLRTMAPGTPVDFALLDSVMSQGGVAVQSEDSFNDSLGFFDMAVTWLNSERVEFLDSLRSRLRVTSSNNQEKDFGANMEEDWISPIN